MITGVAFRLTRQDGGVIHTLCTVLVALRKNEIRTKSPRVECGPDGSFLRAEVKYTGIPDRERDAWARVGLELGFECCENMPDDLQREFPRIPLAA